VAVNDWRVMIQVDAAAHRKTDIKWASRKNPTEFSRMRKVMEGKATLKSEIFGGFFGGLALAS
jgi:hypothetical protein